MQEIFGKIGLENPICVIESLFRLVKGKEHQTWEYQDFNPNMEIVEFFSIVFALILPPMFKQDNPGICEKNHSDIAH